MLLLLFLLLLLLVEIVIGWEANWGKIVDDLISKQSIELRFNPSHNQQIIKKQQIMKKQLQQEGSLAQSIDNDNIDNIDGDTMEVSEYEANPLSSDDANEEGYYVVIPYGTTEQSIMTFCLNILSSVEECEETIDSVYGTWFYNHYTPTIVQANTQQVDWEKDFTATRGSILSLLSDKFGYQSYLEIGCDLDDIFGVAKYKFDDVDCVDPRRGGTIRLTSDEFFGNNTKRYDLIFIDGLHEASQVMTDVHNALEILNPGGTIVLHDCNPRGYLHIRASYPLHPYAIWWNGNTWKAAVTLRLNPDIEIVVVDVDHGVGVVRKRKNQAPLASNWVDFLGDDPIGRLTNQHLSEHRRELIRLVSIQQMEDWLDQEALIAQEVSVYN